MLLFLILSSALQIFSDPLLLAPYVNSNRALLKSDFSLVSNTSYFFSSQLKQATYLSVAVSKTFWMYKAFLCQN